MCILDLITSKIFWDIASPIITAAATIALVWVGKTQSEWVKKTLASTEQNNAVVNRAYVTIVGIGLDARNIASGVLIEVNWKNSGATPAMKFSHSIKTIVLPTGQLPPNTFFDFTVSGDLALSPGQESRSEKNLSSADINSINNGTHALYVWCVCKYYDVFNNNIIRTTEVTRVYSQITFAAPPQSVFYPDHNRYD